MREGIRSSDLRRRSRIRDAVSFHKASKIRWAGHVLQFRDDHWTRAVTDWIPRDIRRPHGCPLTRWSDFFIKSLNEQFEALPVPGASRYHFAALARDRDKWRHYCTHSSKSKINRTTSDTSEVIQVKNYQIISNFSFRNLNEDY